MTFHRISFLMIFSSVWVAEWQPFGKELLTRLTICIFVFRLFVILVSSHFGFEGWIWVLIALVAGLCLLFTFFCLTHFRRTQMFACDVIKASSFARNFALSFIYTQ